MKIVFLDAGSMGDDVSMAPIAALGVLLLCGNGAGGGRRPCSRGGCDCDK